MVFNCSNKRYHAYITLHAYMSERQKEHTLANVYDQHCYIFFPVFGQKFNSSVPGNGHELTKALLCRMILASSYLLYLATDYHHSHASQKLKHC